MRFYHEQETKTMAGSLRSFNYTADDGNTYGITRDESAGETSESASATLLLEDYTAPNPRLPMGVTPRYVLASLRGVPNVRKKFTIGSPAIFQQITQGSRLSEPAGGLMQGGDWDVTFKGGERTRFITSQDTVQQDGDDD